MNDQLKVFAILATFFLAVIAAGWFITKWLIGFFAYLGLSPLASTIAGIVAANGVGYLFFHRLDQWLEQRSKRQFVEGLSEAIRFANARPVN